MRQIILIFSLFAIINANASTWVGITGSWSETQSNINNNVVNGDIVTMPAGTNHWVTALTNNNKIFSLIGAGADLGVQVNIGTPNIATNTYIVNAPDSACTWIIFDGGSGNMINLSANATNYIMRVSGFVVLHGTNSPADSTTGIINCAGSHDMYRIDNIHFYLPAQNCTTWRGWAKGVVDHCVAWTGNEILAEMEQSGYGGWGFGDGSWASPATWGTTNAVVVESNVQTNAHNAAGLVDGQAGSRMIVRYNTSSNAFFAVHGTDTGQRQRAFRQSEVYGNFFFWDTNRSGVEVWDNGIYARGGSWYVFSNYIRGTKQPVKFTYYRAFWGTWPPWKGGSGTNVWDTNNLVALDSGTVSATSAAGTLTDTTRSWTTGQLVGTTNAFIVQKTTTGEYGLITANTPTTITYQIQGSGTGGGINTNVVFQTGDGYTIWQAYALIDQTGFGSGDLLTNNPAVNATLGGIVAYPREYLTPELSYVWSNTVTWDPWQNSQFGPLKTFASSQSPNIISNVHWKQDIAAPAYIPLIYPHPLVVAPTVTDPHIDTQPANQSVTVGQNATFNITASGTGTLHYQWKFNGSNVGSDANSYTRSNCQLADNGGAITCVVTGGGADSPQTSSTATLTVTSSGGGGITPPAALNVNVINANVGNIRSP